MAEKMHWSKTADPAKMASVIAKRLATFRKNRKQAEARAASNRRAAKKLTKKKKPMGAAAHSPATRKRLADAMKARWAAVRSVEATNGHVDRSTPELVPLATYKTSKGGATKKLMASALRQLAAEGAVVRRAMYVREIEVLDMLIKSAEVKG